MYNQISLPVFISNHVEQIMKLLHTNITLSRYFIFLQTHVYGNERRAETKQSDRDQYNVRRVP